MTLVPGYLLPFYRWNLSGHLPTSILVLVAVNQPVALWILTSLFQKSLRTWMEAPRSMAVRAFRPSGLLSSRQLAPGVIATALLVLLAMLVGRQQDALARAIVCKPKVFLMKVPLTSLDAKFRVSTWAQIKTLHHELQTPTINVTHDPIETMTLADRVVVMSRGEVQRVGTPLEIYDSPANSFIASFIGNQAMNLMRDTPTGGVFEAESARIPDNPVSVDLAYVLYQLGRDIFQCEGSEAFDCGDKIPPHPPAVTE